MNTKIFILISIAEKSSSHCDKHQLLHDVEISVWNLTAKKHVKLLFKDKNIGHDCWRPCMKKYLGNPNIH